MRTLVAPADRPAPVRITASVGGYVQAAWRGVTGGCERCPHGIVLHVPLGAGMHCCVCECRT